MLRIGLTGGIGAGKSTVSRRLGELGAVIVDADRIARDVVAPGSAGLAEVTGRFGTGVLTAGGDLDRPALGRIVFGDKAARADLEAITHPRILAETRRRFAGAGDAAIVVHDIPLLVELDRETDYHLVIVVGAAEQIRHDRLVRDRGMAPEDAWSRIRAQADDDQRHRASDVWLTNEGAPEDVLAQVEQLWRERLTAYEDNLRHDRGVRRPDAVAVVDPDPTWAATGDRLARRIQAQLAAAGHQVHVDHIGSTAVPGLAAKDVIDLQVQVGDLAVCEDESFRSGLRAAGVVDPQPSADQPHPWAPDPGEWRKFFARGADPGRIIQVHLRPAAGPAAQLAVECRDWLRAEPAERAAYERVKRDLACRLPGGTPQTREDYVEAKEPWFVRHLPRAHAWAQHRQ